MLNIGNSQPLPKGFETLPARGKYTDLLAVIFEMPIGYELPVSSTECTNTKLRARVNAAIAKYPRIKDRMRAEGFKLRLSATKDDSVLYIRKLKNDNVGV